MLQGTGQQQRGCIASPAPGVDRFDGSSTIPDMAGPPPSASRDRDTVRPDPPTRPGELWRRRLLGWYPALAGVYPALTLAASNATLLGSMWLDVCASIGVCLVAPVLITRAVVRLTKSPTRARMLVTFLWLLTTTYGYVFALLAHRVVVAGVDLGRNRYLLPVWLAVLVAGVVWILARRVGAPQDVAETAVAVSALTLVVLAGGQLAVAMVRAGLKPAPAPVQLAEVTARRPGPATRDVYLILLDAYGSSRTLLRDFGWSNEEFAAALRARGFVLPERTFANYPFTDAAVPAFVSMRYLVTGDDKRRLLHDARLMDLAGQAGYRTVAVSSWLSLVAGAVRAEEIVRPGLLGEFSLELVKATVGGLWLARDAYRTRVTAGLDALETIAADPRPTFTFAHIICPHGPYVFDADGSKFPVHAPIHKAWSSKDFYIKQLSHTNTLVLRTVDRLLAGPSPSPVIVLFSDHGPDYYNWVFDAFHPAPEHLAGMLTSFAAYRLPDRDTPAVVEGMTPVNLGRLVLNLYNDTGLPYLDNRMIWDRGGGLVDVTETVLSETSRPVEIPLPDEARAR